jgi:NAD(P)-dependent dehydrogenase (short-subunit alcohol dehydrogenase family)
VQGKTVVITGAFGALGRAATARARALGARVALVDYAPAPQGAELAFGGVDLADAQAASGVMEQVRAATGAVDALLNIAGGFVWQRLDDGDSAAWDRMHAINLKTAVNACKAALPHLVASSGAIVNVGAAAALKAGAGMGAYAAAKSGVHKLTESLAEELKGKVRVNAVLPSILDTPQNRKDMPDADHAAWVQPDDLAKVMLFLASNDARAITGALVPVTGGV